MVQKINSSTFHFTKSLKHDSVYKIVCMTPKNYLPTVNTIACSKAEI